MNVRSLLPGSQLVLLIAVAGCQSERTAFYPIGLYGVPSTNGFALVRASGFNVVSGPANKPYLDAAERMGLKVLASPGTSAGPRFDPLLARRAIRAHDQHPALWAWYLADEPDMHRIAPEQVREAHRFVKRLSSRRPTAISLYSGFEALDYANTGDITMIDRYPIPWAPLATFDQHVRLTRHALGKKKPLIAVLQSFDWSYFSEQVAGERNLRAPSYDELRCMTYCALVEGATGLFFYAFEVSRWHILEHPEEWAGLQRVVAEIQERLPLFQAEHAWWPWRQTTTYRESDRFNEVEESAVIFALKHLRVGNRAIPPGQYLVGVNTSGKSHSLRFQVPRGSVDEIPVLGENRTLPRRGGEVSDSFSPYAVHVYGPI